MCSRFTFMCALSTALLLCHTADAAEREKSGTLRGTVRLKGKPPELPPLVKHGDGEEIPDESLLVGPKGGVRNVFVYLPKRPAGAKEQPVSEKPLVFESLGCRFVPHAMVVRAGRKVELTNNDPVLHSVHTFPLRNVPLIMAVKPMGAAGAFLVYRDPEPLPILVRDDIHVWMVAYHLPLDHDFAAVTNADGRFEIRNLPPGDHKFRVWHERRGWLERSLRVEIEPDKVTDKALVFSREDFRLE